MKFQEPLLLRYLVKTIEPLSEADPELVANYVVALLKNNKPKEELQKICVTQLEDFLGDNTKSFVTELFHALEDSTALASVDLEGQKPGDDAAQTGHLDQKDINSSLQNDRIPSAIVGTFADHDEQEGSNDDDDDRNPRHTRRVVDPPSLQQHEDGKDVGRKRGRPASNIDSVLEGENDSSRPLGRDAVGSHADREGARKYHKTRHGSTFSSRMNIDGDNKKGGHLIHNEAGVPSFDSFNGAAHIYRDPGRSLSNSSAAWSSHESRFPSFDNLGFAPTLPMRAGATNMYPRRAILNHGSTANPSWVPFGPITGMPSGVSEQSRLLYAGLQAGYAPSLNSSISMARPRLRCNDFEERGFCLRGDMCPMEHGKHIVVNDVQSLEKYNLSVPLPSRPMIGISSGANSGPSGRKGSHEKKHSISPSTSGVEPDLYDPDQPLLNNGHPEAPSGLRKLPSLKRGEDGRIWESDRESSDCGGNSKSQKSVWDRIGPLDITGGKHDGSKIATGSSGTTQKGKQSMDEAYDHRHNCSSLGKRVTEPVLSEGNELQDTSDHVDQGYVRGTIKPGFVADNVNNLIKYNETHKNMASKTARQAVGQKAQRTLFVSCIPAGKNKAELLLSHFKKFGEVLAINIPPNTDRAFVRFSSREEAEAALASPDAVMGNRFIKLAWAKWDSTVEPGKSNATGPAKAASAATSTYTRPNSSAVTARSIPSQPEAPAMSENHSGKISCSNELKSSGHLAVHKQDALETLKLIKEKQEVLAKKREEFRLHLEKLSRQGVGSKIGVIDKDLALKRQKTEVSLSSNDPSSSGKTESPQNVITTAGMEDGGNMHNSEGHPNQTPNTKSLTSAVTSQTLPKSPKLALTPSSASRVRAKVSPRYKLDNRPTAFKILPPLPHGLQNVDTIRDYFASFGDITNVEVEDAKGESNEAAKISELCSVRVMYTTRRAAEKAFHEGKFWQGQGLHLAWVTSSDTANHGLGDMSISQKSNLDVNSKSDVMSNEINNTDISTSDDIFYGSGSVEGSRQTAAD